MSKLFNPYHLNEILLLWIDGDDPYGNEKASSYADGAAVTKVFDKSRNRYSFTSPSTAGSPTYDATNRKIVFDGTDDTLSSATITNFPTAFHIIIAGALDYVADSETDCIFHVDTPNNRDLTFVVEKFVSGGSPETQIKSQFNYVDSSNSSQTGASVAVDAGDNVDNIFEAAVDASNVHVDLNNDTSNVVTDTDDPDISPTGTIQLFKNGSGEFGKGHIYEILMFARTLSIEERNGLQGYLKHKYGLRDEVLKPGLDSSLQARTTGHPFLSNAPKANAKIINNSTTGATTKLPDLFSGLHKINPRTPFNFVRLSLDSNTDNSDATHGDGLEERGGIKQYYFTQEEGDNLSSYVPISYPCLSSITPTAIEIVSTKGISLRGNVTIKLNDFIRGDDTVSFFSKFLAQNPFYLGRRIEIFEGYIGPLVTQYGAKDSLQFFDGRREYIIDSMHLNKNVLTIKAKDPLQLGDDLKSKIPTPSQFSTNTDIADTGGLHTLNIRLDNTTQTSSTISATGFALFQSTFDVFDIAAASITSAQAVSGTKVKLTVNAHGFANGERVTLSGFGTGGTSSVSINASFTISDVDTNTFQITKSGVTNTESFSKTSGRVRKNGFARINEEIVEYAGIKTGSVGSDAAVQLEIVNRAEWGSLGEEHEAGDSIQNCLAIGNYIDTSLGKTIDDVAFDLLVNTAGVPPDAIERRSGQVYSWNDEKDTWLSAFKINTILSEPKEVNKQLSNLASSVGVNFWWDDNAAKILMKADTPILDKSDLQTIDDDQIILNSFNLINSEKERISRVFYYYGIKNHTADRDKAKNFRNLYVAIDGDSESSAQYGVESNKVMFNWGISDTSTATSVTQRLLQRFKNTPTTCQFDVDSSVDYLKTGDHFFLQTRHILNPNGTEKENIEMQVLSVTYDSKRQTNRIKAKTFRFVGNTLSRITVNIDTINAAGSGYSAGNTLSQASVSPVGGTGMTVTVNTVSGSAVATYTVTDYGQGYDTGDVVTFNGGGGNFALNINRGFFPQEGTGSGTDSDPYLGDRLTNAYISCDSAIATANGGADSRVFISTTILNAGSGYANGTHAFTGTEIQGASRGSGLALSVVVSGNAVTGVSVTSNPASGSERAETSHKGYLDNETLNLIGHSGTNAQIKITVAAKMTTGGEAYVIA